MPAQPRVALIDIARTLALIAMVIFHFTYDLELFGFAPQGTMASLEWRLFAQGIAGSFIFLSGVSLVIATLGGPLALRKYLRRLAMLALAAAAVTIGTYFANGPAFVRFGILHLLFAASLLGPLALRAPFWLTLASGAIILGLPHLANWPFLGDVRLLWIGVTKAPMPGMVDYVPLIPWLGVFLIGMAAAQLIARLGKWPNIAALIDPTKPLAKCLSWPGQHSLAIYLIHQPVLFGAVYLARILAG
ncbi:heparan-alpha-glucosaminide N-acetyltransferase [Planktotalea sp.]|uniref:heparan-alpha-glucosaminide N-acetyltransferase n=1 Tax=Planktotalea sp. TaxID=2029877 RepID=UPI003D6AF5EC